MSIIDQFYVFKFEQHSLGPTLHVELSAKDDQHIGAAIVEHPCPVVDHPGPGVLMDELVLEVEHIRVVWCHLDIHFCVAAESIWSSELKFVFGD